MSEPLQRYTFTLNLSPQAFLAFYQGHAQSVQVTAHDGRIIRFPANILRQFLTHQGIQGTYCLVFNSDTHRLKSIQKMNK